MPDSFLSKPETQPKSSLSEQNVSTIFMAGKPCALSGTMKLWSRGQILALAKHFKVTPKTIRDIWNRRTWRNVTSRLVEENGVLFSKKVKIGTEQHLPVQEATQHGPEIPCFSRTLETHSLPLQQAASATFDIGLGTFNAERSNQARRQPDLSFQSLEHTSPAQTRVPQRPCLHWPGDALLLAVAAHNHIREAAYEELPTQGGAGTGVSAVDPFAGDWTY